MGGLNRQVITSIDALAEASQAAGIVPILLRPGLIRASVIRADLGSVVANIMYCSVPLAFRAETAADRIWLVAPRNRTSSGHLNGESLTPGDLLTFGGSVEVAGASAAPFVCGMVSIASDALDRTATAFGVKSNAPGEGELRVVRVRDGVRLSRAFEFLSYTAHHQNSVALMRRETSAIEHAFLQIAVRSLEGDSSSSRQFSSARRKSARIARACENFARKSRYHNVTLSALCEASGLSERRVRSAFYDCYGMSPTAFLRVTALNAVRRDILNGSDSGDAVSRAALDWGFWHLGRFAAQYRALFGESPSHTLRHRADRPLVAAS